jgi:hypothetical protein
MTIPMYCPLYCCRSARHRLQRFDHASALLLLRCLAVAGSTAHKEVVADLIRVLQQHQHHLTPEDLARE